MRLCTRAPWRSSALGTLGALRAFGVLGVPGARGAHRVPGAWGAFHTHPRQPIRSSAHPPSPPPTHPRTNPSIFFVSHYLTHQHSFPFTHRFHPPPTTLLPPQPHLLTQSPMQNICQQQIIPDSCKSGFPSFSWALLASPGLSEALLGSPGLSWVLLGSPGLSWALLGFPGLSWALLGSPGLSWALLGPPGLS